MHKTDTISEYFIICLELYNYLPRSRASSESLTIHRCHVWPYTGVAMRYEITHHLGLSRSVNTHILHCKHEHSSVSPIVTMHWWAGKVYTNTLLCHTCDDQCSTYKALESESTYIDIHADMRMHITKQKTGQASNEAIYAL